MSTAKREHRLPCRAMLGLTQSQLKQRQDPNGSNCLKIEGTTSQPWSEGYKGVHEARSNLPAWQELDLFLNAESQVIIVDSPTGSGKSTQIPQACAHALDHAGCTGQVLVTQPRRIPTMECGKRLGVEMDLKVGVALGIEMRGEVIMPDDRQDARIITMTDGLLSNKIAGDPDLKNVAVVIIDEVHERGVNMDLALGLLKIILGRRSDLRVVCMSATGENSTLLTHFEAFAPLLVKLSGQAKKIHRTFLKHVEVDWERCAHQAVQQILRDRQHSLPKGDILIFCPGEREIFQLRERVQEIKDSYPAECQHVDIFTLFRDLPRVEQAKVLEDKFDPILWTDGTQRKVLRRKVILATNIAETSITFPHLDYVVDCGENKQAGFIPKYNANELLLAPCSKAQIIQRVGRVGRIRQGYAICLYTEDIYKTLPDFPQPPILRTDMTATIMKLLFVGLPTGGLGTFPWPSFVKHDTLALTDQGKVAAQLNLNPQLAKLFLEGIGSGVEGDLLVLVAMLEGSNIQKVGVDDKEEATSFYKTFVHERGDHFTLVNLWKAWKAHQQSKSTNSPA
nr:uncharacterized protein CI109_002211 [Kwoniella shandongensis]KAA5529318.1 hypothetical protein CI109_002211 [Kwoniella shandongensis]